MINFKLLIFLFGISILQLSGCTKSTVNCGTVKFRSIDFSEFSSVKIYNDEIENKFLVINSQKEFEENISISYKEKQMSNQFNIDYEEKTLLIGKAKLTGIEGTLIAQKIVKKCDSDKYIYKVRIQNGGYTALGNFYFGVVISKKVRTDIEFDIETIE